MANRTWLENVRRQLADNGLPPAYIRRFMEELADHYQDVSEHITEENMSTEKDVASRLGEPSELAEAAVYAFRRRTFLGRHPAAAFLVFGLAPLASLLGLFLLAFACLYGGFTACERLGFDLKAIKQLDPAASVVLPYLLSLLMVMLPAALASLLYCKLIRRCGISRRWMILSSLVLAIVAILPIWTVSLSDQPGQSALRCGIGSPQNIAGTLVIYFSSFQQWLQFLTPLCVGLWFLRRMHKGTQRTEEPRRLAA